jgi:signal transduction histidine kinase
MGRMPWFWRLLLVFWGLQAWHPLLLGAPPETAAEPVALRLQSASLTSPLGERTVTLPHVLSHQELDAKGSRVRYRLSVDLPKAPEQALGVFINKLSLAGALYLNGELVDQCADGDLARLRCLHHPLLFKPATQLWHAGINTLEIEVHGNHGQLSGLSEVVVGDAHRLYRDVYLPQFMWRITLKEWLAWSVLTLGLLSLVIGLSLREESVYLWYGLTCLFLVASLSNLIAKELPLSMHFWNWLTLTSRLLAAHLFVLTCLHLFGKQRAWHTRWTLGYALLFATVFYAATENSLLVLVAYLPVLLIAPVLIGFMLRWSVQSGDSRHIVTCGLMILLFMLGLRDWLMFSGLGGFEFMYLTLLGFATTIVLIGFLLTRQLIDSLRSARGFSATLESTVAARTLELSSALETIQRIEQTALKLTEAIPVGTYVLEVSPDGKPRFSFLSKRWLEMFNITRELVMADPTQVLSRVHPDDLMDLVNRHRQVFLQPQVLTWEGRILVRGETRWVSVEAVPRTLPDGSTAFEGVSVDVTFYKHAQAAVKIAHEQLTRMAIHDSKNEEREMLLQDMHDGFGSQLATARLMADAGKISPGDLSVLLQECMADLYLVADTLSNAHNSFLDSLADMRFRLQKRTAHLPIALAWELDIDKAPKLLQRTILQLLRIIQEAVNNALKHAQAKHIQISVTFDPEASQLRITVSDNGTGYPDKPVLGRGVYNMQQRARTVGATLLIAPSHPGTCVSLSLLLPQA